MKGGTFKGRRELTEKIMENALEKRIKMLRVWEERKKGEKVVVLKVSRAEG